MKKKIINRAGITLIIGFTVLALLLMVGVQLQAMAAANLVWSG